MSRFAQILLLVCVTAVSALAQHKVSVSVRGRTAIRITLEDAVPPSPLVAAKLMKAANYRLSEDKKLPRDFAPRLQSAVAKVNAATTPEDKDTALAGIALIAAELGPAETNLIDLNADPNDFQVIDLTLLRPLEYGKTYELIVTGLDSPEDPSATKISVSLPASPSAKIVNSLDAFRRNEIRIVSDTNSVLSSGNLGVDVRTLRLRSDAMGIVEKISTIPAQRGQNSIPPNQITLRLSKKLQDNRTYELTATGITDGSQPISGIKGRIKFPGLPLPPDDPKWDVNLSSETAVAQKPQFNLTANINPRSPERLDRKGWVWQPNVRIDVGIGDTKSDNSITFDSPFVRSLIQPPYFANPNEPPAMIDVRESKRQRGKVNSENGQIPHYKDWSDTPWLHLSDVTFSLGPKLETDRKFKRFNTVGSLGFDFHFPRLMGSIKQRRNLLKRDLKHKDESDNEADLVVLKHGFTFVPYLFFDFGAHANNENVKKTVDNKELSLLVPRHAIARSIVGFKANLEWSTFSIPTTLSLNESVFFLGVGEKIGYSTDQGVFLRELKGFQPHFKTSLDFAFDSAKHYSFDVTFENGRQAPNFEYLNKITAGIRVLY
jgi:hypothetical protein